MIFDHLARMMEEFDKCNLDRDTVRVQDGRVLDRNPEIPQILELLNLMVKRAAIFEVSREDLDQPAEPPHHYFFPLNPMVVSVTSGKEEYGCCGVMDLSDRDLLGGLSQEDRQLVFHASIARADADAPESPSMYRRGDRVLSVCLAYVAGATGGSRWHGDGWPWLMVFNIDNPDGLAAAELTTEEADQRAAIQAIEASVVTHGLARELVNRPNRWIVERTNEKARPVLRGKIPRSDQRPRYLTISEQDLHKKLKLVGDHEGEDGDAAFERASHRRRAHQRLLSAERYKNRGAYVHVKACWVGPKQWQNKHEVYRVLIDK